MLVVAALAAGQVAVPSAKAAPFSFAAGDLVVSVVGNASNTANAGTDATGNTGANANTFLDNQAAPLTLDEFTTTGTAVGMLTLPTVSSGSNNAISGEYGSSSEGSLSLSGDGHSLTIAGYGVNAAAYNSAHDLNGTGTALAQTCSLSNAVSCAGVPQVSRVVALIGADGSVDTSTALFNVFNENNPRSVVTQNGSTFYLAGQGISGDTTEGVFLANKGASSATAINTQFDARTVGIVNNQLFVSVDSKVGTGQNAFIATVGSGLPTAATALAPLPGLATGSPKSAFIGNVKIALGNGNGNTVNQSSGSIALSPENYFFANSTTLYVADGGIPKAGGIGDGGLQKWSLVTNSKGGLSWVLDYTLSQGLNLVNNSGTAGTTGLVGLTGEVVTLDGIQEVELFATNATIGDTDPTFLYGITDLLGDVSAPTDESFTVLAAAGPDSNFRGVAFAPEAVPEPTTLALFAAGLVGLGFRRRKTA
jgi:hypothetical protein